MAAPTYSRTECARVLKRICCRQNSSAAIDKNIPQHRLKQVGSANILRTSSQVLLGHGVTRCNDGSYSIDGNDEPPTELLRLVNRMVGRLHEEAKRFFSAYPDRSTNYEDIYYLARQVSDDLSGEMENPAIRCFVEAIKAAMSPLVKDASAKNENPNEHYEPHVPNDLKELLEETCNYIADVVSKSLLSSSSTAPSTGFATMEKSDVFLLIVIISV